MSRVENGRQKLSMPKLMPICRVLEVPAEVLVERMELDLELEKSGGPDTEGLTFAELIDAGNLAMRTGRVLDQYGYFRDSVFRASVDPLRKAYRDKDEQKAMSLAACAYAAGNLGRHAFRLYEFDFVLSLGTLRPQYEAYIYSLRSSALIRRGNVSAAAADARTALELVSASDHPLVVAAILRSSSVVAQEHGDWRTSIEHLKSAHKIFSEHGTAADCAYILNDLAEVYIDAGNLRAARLTLDVASRHAEQSDIAANAATKALQAILCAKQGRHEEALDLMKEASNLARRRGDKLSRFRYDLHLLRFALRVDNQETVRVVWRRLIRTSAWVPSDSSDFIEYSRVREENNIVSDSQHPG